MFLTMTSSCSDELYPFYKVLPLILKSKAVNVYKKMKKKFF